MPKYYLLRNNGSYSDFADYPETPEARPYGEWIEGEPTDLELYQPFDVETVIEQVNGLLVYAQETSASNPFPLDRQEEIFDLVGRIENYLRKRAFPLAFAKANSFDAAEWDDLDEVQKTMAGALKAQILALLPNPETI